MCAKSPQHKKQKVELGNFFETISTPAELKPAELKHVLRAGSGVLDRPTANNISDDVKAKDASMANLSPNPASSKPPAKTVNVNAKKQFRCNFKHALLTYGGFAPGEVELNEFRLLLQSKGDTLRIRIGEEKYTEPQDPTRPFHIHVAVRYSGKPNTKKSALVTADDEFDSDGNPIYAGKTSCPYDFTTKDGRVVHPNIKTHNPKKASKSTQHLSAPAQIELSERSMFLYVGKGEQPKNEWEKEHENGAHYGANAKYVDGGDVATFLKESIDKLNKRASNAEVFAEAAAASSVQEAMDVFWKKAPEQAFKYAHTMEKNFRQRLGGFSVKTYELSDFEAPPLDLSKPLVLAGKSGMGKTNFLKAHGKYPLVVKTLDGLRKITETTDLVIFDDMNFRDLGLTADQMIALLDIEETITIKTRPNFKGDDATLRAGLKRAFSTNLLVREIFPDGKNPEQQTGIDRRFNLVTVTKPLFNPKVQRFRKAMISVATLLLKRMEPAENQ